METELISVIVPVYRVERYLKKCVDSILRQTYAELEIWLVDDGSPDGCPQICEGYAAKDSRVHVIHQENSGLSCARNAALERMTGEYVSFVDSDDFIKEDLLERLYESLKAAGADISVTNLTCVGGNGKPLIDGRHTVSGEEKVVLTPEEAFQAMMYQEQFDTAAQGKLYHRSLFQEIRFPEGRLYEDLATLYRIILCSRKVVFTESAGYFYLIRADGIEQSAFSERKMDMLSALEEIVAYAEGYGKECRDAAQSRLVSGCFHLLFQMPPDSPCAVKPKEYIRDCRWEILRNPKARKRAKAGCLISFLGYRAARKIFAVVIKRENRERQGAE